MSELETEKLKVETEVLKFDLKVKRIKIVLLKEVAGFLRALREIITPTYSKPMNYFKLWVFGVSCSFMAVIVIALTRR